MDAYVVYITEKDFPYNRFSGKYFFELYDALDYMDKYLVLSNHARVTEEDVEIFWEDLALTIELQEVELHLEQIHIYKKWEV